MAFFTPFALSSWSFLLFFFFFLLIYLFNFFLNLPFCLFYCLGFYFYKSLAHCLEVKLNFQKMLAKCLLSFTLWAVDLIAIFTESSAAWNHTSFLLVQEILSSYQHCWAIGAYDIIFLIDPKGPPSSVFPFLLCKRFDPISPAFMLLRVFS